MSKLFRNQRALRKQINITIREVENRQWCVKTTEPEIQLVGDNKEQLLALVKAGVLKQLVDSLESFNLDINQIKFKIIDLSLKSKFSFASIKNLPAIWCNNLVKWSREEPHFEYFLQTIIFSSALGASLSFFGFVLSSILLIKSLLNNDQTFPVILTSLITFFGVIFTVLINNWITLYKSQIEHQADAAKKMCDYYKLIIKILKQPRFYSLEEITNFIDNFDNKVEIYSSSNIVYQWKRIKERIPLVQANASNTDNKDYHEDYHDFKNFIGAIRKEIGYSSTPGVRSHIHKELKRRYQNRESENS